MPLFLVSIFLKSEWVIKLKGTLFYFSPKAYIDITWWQLWSYGVWYFCECLGFTPGLEALYGQRLSDRAVLSQYSAQSLKHLNRLHFPGFHDDALKLLFIWFWTMIQIRAKNSANSVFSVVPILPFQQCVWVVIWLFYCILLTIKMSIQYKLVFRHWW